MTWQGKEEREREREKKRTDDINPPTHTTHPRLCLSPDNLPLGTLQVPLPLPHLIRPPFYTLAAAADLDLVNLDPLHAGRVLEPRVAGHAAGVGALLGHELEHRGEEVGDAAALVLLEVVLLAEDVGQGPVAQAVDVAQLALAVEDLLRPLARQAQRFGEGAEQLDDLRDVVVVLAVLGARLRVEEVVARNEFKDLGWMVREE